MADINPLIKAEIGIRKQLVQNDKLIEFLKAKNITLLKDQDPKENITSFSEVIKNFSYVLRTKNSKTKTLTYKYKEAEGVTEYVLQNKFDPKKPTFIFHHGIGEFYHPMHLQLVIPLKFFEMFNIYSIKSSNHKNFREVITKMLNKVINIEGSMAGSTYAIEEIVKEVRSKSQEKIIVAGVSLGGIATSMHYFYFNSADYYFPVIAYPDFYKILSNPLLEKVVANYEELNKNTFYKKSFEIDKTLAKRNKDNIFPIIGQHDSLMAYETCKEFWKGYKIKEMDCGHTTVVLKRKELSGYISKICLINK